MPTKNEKAKNGAASKQSFYQRLRKNTQGNTLAMVAAGLVPLAGIIGGGVDISRAYMVKTRLQQACDAGVLAGRRAMGDGSYDSNAQAQTNKFFNANFPLDYLKTKERTFIPSNPGGGSTVIAKASVTLPTVIMKIFGADGIDVAVKCRAVLEIANSDITMVLDSTGSMLNNIDADDDGGSSTTRIAALRAAMKSFYSIVDSAAAGSASRIRYAMVPYTGTVNVGKAIYDVNPQYLVGGTAGDTFGYQSRRAWYIYDEITYTRKETAGDVTQKPDEEIQFQGSGDCDDYSNNVNARTFTGVYQQNGSWYGSGMYTWTPASAGYSSGEPANRTDDSNGRYTFSKKSYSGASNFKCVRTVTRTAKATIDEEVRTPTLTLDPTKPGAVFAHWEHMKIEQPVFDYVRSIAKNPSGSYTFGAAPTPTSRTGGTSRWAGCIQEIDTAAANNIEFNGAAGKITPGSTKDLDIDIVPNSKATRWRAYWPEVAFVRDGDAAQNYTETNSNRSANFITNPGGKPQVSCPTEARNLQEFTKTQYDNYVDSLVADGGTYHDMGMLWGARFSSPDGIFSSNVRAVASNNGYVSRHLIFLTDGQLDIGNTYYSAYGHERHDKRIGGGNETTATANHKARFQALCEATRAKGIRVWVIAFATNLSTEMSNCASPNSAFTSNNASALNETFTTIAQTVADLRLSQ